MDEVVAIFQRIQQEREGAYSALEESLNAIKSGFQIQSRLGALRSYSGMMIHEISASVVADFLLSYFQSLLKFWVRYGPDNRSMELGHLRLEDLYIAGNLNIDLAESVRAYAGSLGGACSVVPNVDPSAVPKDDLAGFHIGFEKVFIANSCSVQLVGSLGENFSNFILRINVGVSDSSIGTFLLRGPGFCRIVFRRSKVGQFHSRNLRSMSVLAEQTKFDDVSISGRAGNLTTAKSIQFSKETSLSSLTFEFLELRGPVSLNDAKVATALSFRDCVFRAAPDFHGTELPSNTVFERARLHLKSTHIEERDCLRALRVKMRKIGARESESLFFVQEQRASRRLLWSRGAVAESAISWFYDAVSAYGTSPRRALAWFVGWNVAFLISFALVLLPCAVDWMCVLPADAIRYSDSSRYTGVPLPAMLLGQDLINPTALFTDKALVRVDSGIVALLCVIHTLGAFGILTLLMLSIRSMFQRGGGGSDS